MAELNASLKIVTEEMHTGGEPLRILTPNSGYPPIPGKTILEQRAYARDNLDHLRRLLMHEPRGHYDMYGAILVDLNGEGDDKEKADLAALFMHNEGYSTMCGHAVIALGRFAIDTGIIKNPTSPETEVRIQCPCGLVRAYTEFDSTTKKTGATRFHSVSSYAFALDHQVTLPGGGGQISVDVGYGGAFYLIVPGERIGVDVVDSPIGEIVKAATSLKEVVSSTLSIYHPESPDLAFLYGVIVTDGKDAYDPHHPTTSITVFADSEVDRSPCGSGTTARMAVMFTRGLIEAEQTRTFTNSKTQSEFTAKVVQVLPNEESGKEGEKEGGKAEGGKSWPRVVVEVKGNAYYTGTSTFIVEEDDPLRRGFLIK